MQKRRLSKEKYHERISKLADNFKNDPNEVYLFFWLRLLKAGFLIWISALLISTSLISSVMERIPYSDTGDKFADFVLGPAFPAETASVVLVASFLSGAIVFSCGVVIFIGTTRLMSDVWVVYMRKKLEALEAEVEIPQEEMID